MSAQNSLLPVEGGIDITLVLVTLTSLLLCYFLYANYARRRVWKKYGVRQGNMGYNIAQSIDSLLEDGVDTVGVNMSRMALVTRDLRLLREIMVKQFNNFPDRTDIVRTRTYLSRGVAFLRGSSWKQMRQVISPSFSTSKMKQMSSCVHSSAQKLVSVFEACAREDRLIEVRHFLGQYTSGIIAKTGFGLTTDCLSEQDNEFTKHCKNIMKNTAPKGLAKLLKIIAFEVPGVNKFLIENLKIDSLDAVNIESDRYFNEILHMAIRERTEIEKSDKRKPADFLQNLISSHVAADKPNTSKAIVTEADVIGQSLLILFAAFETTASTLRFCFLLLAMNPDIQEKIYKEIIEVVPLSDDTMNDGEEEDGSKATRDSAPTLEQLQSLRYTQQVIDETLRMYPPAPVITRYANETRTFTLGPGSDGTSQAGRQTSGTTTTAGVGGDSVSKRRGETSSASEDTPKAAPRDAEKITIPAGTSIMIPIAKIHKDPRHYPDPQKFDPDRFLPENKAARDPLSFMPFGFGPRQCIGMRMAYLEIKTALVYVLRRVRLEVNDQTEPKAGGDVSVAVIGGLVVNPLKPIKLAVRLR